MAEKLTGGLAPDLNLGDGCVLRFSAVSPTDGSDVSGVVVSNVNIAAGDESSGAQLADAAGPFILVPGPDA